MTIHFHPTPGTILICDFNGLKIPEMTKKRPVIAISPNFKHRTKLCTIVPLSTTDPLVIQPYHYKLHFDSPLPYPYNDSNHAWVKADMIYTMSFARLSPMLMQKDTQGKREYDIRLVDKYDLIKIQECILFGIGLN